MYHFHSQTKIFNTKIVGDNFHAILESLLANNPNYEDAIPTNQAIRPNAGIGSNDTGDFNDTAEFYDDIGHSNTYSGPRSEEAEDSEGPSGSEEEVFADDGIQYELEQFTYQLQGGNGGYPQWEEGTGTNGESEANETEPTSDIQEGHPDGE